MDDFGFVHEYWSLEDEELNNCFQVITFSLWDHWLSREEFEKLFPDENSKEFGIVSSRFIDASKEVLGKEEFFIVDNSGDQFVIKNCNVDDLPPEYNYNASNGPYFIPRLQMVYEIGFDYCISICCKSETVVNEKLEVLRKFGLKRIKD